MWQRQKVSPILSVKLVQRSASEKKNEPYFLMAARKVCSIRRMGCCCNAPEECSTSLPCCSGVKRSFAPGQFRHVSPYTATPCMEKIGERGIIHA